MIFRDDYLTALRLALACRGQSETVLNLTI